MLKVWSTNGLKTDQTLVLLNSCSLERKSFLAHQQVFSISDLASILLQNSTRTGLFWPDFNSLSLFSICESIRTQTLLSEVKATHKWSKSGLLRILSDELLSLDSS